MKSLKVTWKGISPLIMHSCKCVNPLHPIAKELKKYTSKKTKTDEDLTKISDLEWESRSILERWIRFVYASRKCRSNYSKWCESQ